MDSNHGHKNSIGIFTVSQPPASISVKIMSDHKYFLVSTIKGNATENSQIKDPEIIEITLVIVNKDDQKIDDHQFHAYVKPKLRSKLDEKCKESHHVYQYSIDQADQWSTVEINLEKWLKEKGLNARQENFILVADGHAGFEKLLKSQCHVSGTSIPDWAKRWVNVRKEFKTAHESVEHAEKLDLQKMSEIAGLHLHGSKKGHGRDEAFDLASIVLSLLRRGHDAFQHVERLSL